MKRLVIMAAVLAVVAWAADISGAWKGTAENQGSTIERTFVFKVDGTRLSGETTSERMGKSTIADGKMDGDNISFTISAKLQDNDVKMNFKGKVAGGGQSIEWTLKKSS